MKAKIIKTEKEYNEACARIYLLMHSSENPIEPNSPAGKELKILSLIVEKYEQNLNPGLTLNPIEAIRFRME